MTPLGLIFQQPHLRTRFFFFWNFRQISAFFIFCQDRIKTSVAQDQRVGILYHVSQNDTGHWCWHDVNDI
jgi:hypothetical protein